MNMQEVKSALEQKTPCEFHASGEWFWLPEGWHEVFIIAYDEDPKNPRVWLKCGCSSGIEVQGKKDIKNLLRVKG